MEVKGDLTTLVATSTASQAHLQDYVVNGHLDFDGERVPGLILVEHKLVVDVKVGQGGLGAGVSARLTQLALVVLLGVRQLSFQGFDFISEGEGRGGEGKGGEWGVTECTLSPSQLTLEIPVCLLFPGKWIWVPCDPAKGQQHARCMLPQPAPHNWMSPPCPQPRRPHSQ